MAEPINLLPATARKLLMIILTIRWSKIENVFAIKLLGYAIILFHNLWLKSYIYSENMSKPEISPVNYPIHLSLNLSHYKVLLFFLCQFSLLMNEVFDCDFISWAVKINVWALYWVYSFNNFWCILALCFCLFPALKLKAYV